jgi:hypothetical protein
VRRRSRERLQPERKLTTCAKKQVVRLSWLCEVIKFSAPEKLPSDNVAQDHGKYRHGAAGEFAQPKLFRRQSLVRF